MAMSGIELDETVLNTFITLKQNKAITYKPDSDEKSQIKWFSSKFNKPKNPDKIIIDEIVYQKEVTGDNKKVFDDLAENLKEEEPRFIIFDFHTKNDEGSIREKPVFFAWCSDNAPTKQKMIFASSKATLTTKFEMSDHCYHWSDRSDIDYKEVDDKLQKKK